MFNYPEKVTEVFDDANFHIKYTLSFLKKYIKGNILEVGSGCGSFTRNYFNKKIKKAILTETDEYNFVNLKKIFRNNTKIKVQKKTIDKISGKFNAILYFHVLEHIKNDDLEIKNAVKNLKKNGYLLIVVPAHQKIYGKLDKLVGHYRRYDIDFFKKKINAIKLKKLIYLDFMGYMLYFLNNIFFKKETFPSKFKIFIWDKIFTPITIIVDFIIRYRFGKCILVIFKKK